jgi:hypothetical protein
MALKFLFEALTGQFERKTRAIYRPIATAGTAAIKDAANQIKKEGRANIGAAGFSRRWQNALRVDVFPRVGVSADAALLARHRIPYAGVFERGAQIRGKPLLWIPLSGTPAKLGGKRFSPRVYRQMIGPLRAFTSRRGTPLLGGPLTGRPGARITANALRRGARGERGRSGLRIIPLFFGIPAVNIRARFGLNAVFARAAAGLAAAYLRHLRG